MSPCHTSNSQLDKAHNNYIDPTPSTHFRLRSSQLSDDMAPKAEKKPGQPAKKAVAKKSTAGRKKGSKKAVESYKIYIYKVCCAARIA